MSAKRQSPTTRFGGRGLVPRLAAVVALAAGTALALAGSQPASAGIVPTVQLATSADYSVLGATTVTNTNLSVLGQSVGLSPGTSIVGFPPGIVLPPATVQAATAVTLQAQSDLTTAYDDAAGRSVEFTLPDPDMVGQTLIPGVYAAAAKAPLALSGALTLDGQDNPDAVFIFQTDSTLITSSGSTITLINGASACNVFWQVGSSATLGSGSFFTGTILALASITVESSAAVEGRALARTGAVTLDNNVFTEPICAAVIPTTTAPATTAPATTAPAVTTTVAADVTTPTSPVATTSPSPVATTSPSPIDTTSPSPVATTSPSPIDTTSPSVVSEETTTTYTFTVTDITLPRTGGSLPAQSGIGFAVALIGLAALVIARRRQPA